MVNLNKLCTKNTLIGLGLGQFLSLLITSTGFSSSELARKGINAPTSQSLANYVLLAIVYGSILIYRQKKLKVRFYYFCP
ncbi:solute carrier family 35 protein [Thalictrum thalictroides]|uniref:Solute carrier family 35 protein n=1 Tax=Thalictrum thalictroides TaxID=46969 RepID=A0A7J6WV08_THATH|nr:solute carrier family 35 protein [Thalictrum thalictroides]